MLKLASLVNTSFSGVTYKHVVHKVNICILCNNVLLGNNKSMLITDDSTSGDISGTSL